MQAAAPGAVPQPVVALRGVTKVYRTGEVSVSALAGVDLAIVPGELLAIIGPSGSGKSTLMNILGCLDRPSAGEYRLAGRPVARLDDDELAEVRNRTIGFVFQNYNLLSQLTALQNVEVPLIYRGMAPRRRRERAVEALTSVGLRDRVWHRPTQLSGGQQQRVSIARALVGEPAILLADEPTGNLDSHAGADVMELILGLNAGGMTVVIVTHDAAIARRCKRVVRVADGRIVHDGPVDDAALGVQGLTAGVVEP